MARLDNYRKVRVTVDCSADGGPIVWELWTTRTEEQLRAYAASVGRTVCAELGREHWSQHTVSMTTMEEPAKGALRG